MPYLDCDIQLYQVTKNLFNVRVQIYDEHGSVIKEVCYRRLAWTVAVHMARTKYLTTRATLGAKSQRATSEDGQSLFQDEMPF